MEYYFIVGAVMGAIIGWTVRYLVELSGKANAFEWELHEHSLDIGIRKEKVVEDEKAVIDRVTDDFTAKLSEIIADNIVCEEDFRKDFIKYSVKIWTKFS